MIRGRLVNDGNLTTDLGKFIGKGGSARGLIASQLGDLGTPAG